MRSLVLALACTASALLPGCAVIAPDVVTPLLPAIVQPPIRVTLTEPPIALATASAPSNGAMAQITNVDRNGFTVEGRKYDDFGLADMAFSFLAVKGQEK